VSAGLLVALLGGLTGTAMGQEPEPDMVIEVVGDADVAAARAEVVDAMAEVGWRLRRTRRGAMVFRGPKLWMGRAIVSRWGDVHFTKPVLSIAPPQGRQTEYSEGLALGQPKGGQAVRAPGPPGLQDLMQVARSAGPKVVRGAQAPARAGVAGALDRYRSAMYRRNLHERIDAIREDLDALWSSGVALDGGPPLSPGAARREAVLTFWATRTPTAEGRAVAQVVAAWFRQVVMTSEMPATAEEIVRTEARRADGLVLGIDGTR